MRNEDGKYKFYWEKKKKKASSLFSFMLTLITVYPT